MPNIAIFAREGARQGALATVARKSGAFVDGAGDVPALQRLLDRRPIDVVLADGLSTDDLTVFGDYASRFVVLADEADVADLALAGAAAVLPREASVETIGAALVLAGQGLRLL